MAFYMGIDLGSTTSKALIIDDEEKIVGEGLTNTRSDYLVAVKVAEEDAKLDAKFTFLRSGMEENPVFNEHIESIFQSLLYSFKFNHHKRRIEKLRTYCFDTLDRDSHLARKAALRLALNEIFTQLQGKSPAIAESLVREKSQFFRDIVTTSYMDIIERIYKDYGVPFESLMTIYDKGILISENELSPLGFSEGVEIGINDLRYKELVNDEQVHSLRSIVDDIDRDLTIDNRVGTGYGRQLLPFPKEQIFSEILCHGLGSHYFFPNTRTVLDIGGQDTKAIQIDENGMVISFNMNDRCAAGCGRFLGYIADQLSVGVVELSDLAFAADKLIKISSTCTVFAGAEVKAKLSLGETRENLVFSLETAMAKRAMSLIARSKGVFNEFTFSGGVAKNQSMVSILGGLVEKHYGKDIKMNVSPDSIFAGALGAALFAKRKG
jgi:benzoyl-CoA reductase subunit A